MFNVDIAALVRESLLKNGCDPAVLEDFDAHSTIALEFSNQPSILIDNVNGDIWLSAKLTDTHSYKSDNCAIILFQESMKDCAFSRTGKCQFDTIEECFYLKVMLHPDYLENSEQFSKALAGFFETIERLVETII